MARSRTTRVLLLGRNFLEDNDPKRPVELIKKTFKIYPYQPGGIRHQYRHGALSTELSQGGGRRRVAALLPERDQIVTTTFPTC